MYKIKKGLDLPISGVPSSELEDSSKISTVAVLGSDYNGLKPTMLVKVGDTVSAGQKLLSHLRTVIWCEIVVPRNRIESHWARR